MFPQTDLKRLSVTHAGGTTDYFYSPEKKERCLVHISGIHGVEGYIGSLIQHEILKMRLADLPCQPVIVHVVNPYGKTHCLRTNAHNVDLNRNFLSPHQIHNPHFKSFETYFKTAHLRDAIPVASLLLRHGLKQAVMAAACGQTEFPDSLFFAGDKLQPELISLQETLSSLIHPEAELFVLDIHSGLGRKGAESLMVDGFGGEAERDYFQNLFKKRIVWPGRTAGSYRAEGPVSLMLKKQWKTMHVFQEFGTYPPLHVLKALIRKESEEMLEVFFPKDPEWRKKCTELGVLRFRELVAAIS